MKIIRSFSVIPALPDELKPIYKIAKNLWWCWNPDAVELFRRIDRKKWTALNHNPVRLLGEISQERLKELVANESFMDHLSRVEAALDAYMEAETWFKTCKEGECAIKIAYFSAEFGLHESMPIYSGGLGVLAGDHLKSASEIGIPLIGVGLLYHQGYFNQYLNLDGWQQEEFRDNDFFTMPLELQKDDKGKTITISVTLPGGEVHAQIWKLQVGRVPLFLLDTNIDSNSPEHRQITACLYGGDTSMRISQEILLGIGGIRALRALDVSFDVCHMNEGHSAFLGLERVKIYMEESHLSFDEAREVVKAATVFTTHTPVPAGNDRFPNEVLMPFVQPYLSALGLSQDAFLALGRENPDDKKEPFCMTVLALNFSTYANGVSKLHGEVSRKMWKNMWPAVPTSEVPIKSITNGVHTRSWISDEMKILFDRYLGPRWIENPVDMDVWQRVYNIPDYELWRGGERLRERLATFARSRLKKSLMKRGASAEEVAQAEQILDPDAMTIGFARRFATYKRAGLIFKDMDRLIAILNNKKMPVQIVFSGKAHPADKQGKELIKEIVHIARRPELRNKIVFLEDYDMRVARYLVQGCDLWLNNPRRPLEASGTSGMKVVPNGGLNLSVLDGWWCEAYNMENGWALGSGEEYADTETQDLIESKSLYDLLEREVVPLFYRRGGDGIPHDWLQMVKRSMASICPVFNTNRMVRDYYYETYYPAFSHRRKLVADNFKQVKHLTVWKNKLKSQWGKITVKKVDFEKIEALTLGQKFSVSTLINLGDIHPDEVLVQICSGVLNKDGELEDFNVIPMEKVSCDGNTCTFSGEVVGEKSGRNGCAIRILPYHGDMAHPFERGLICWV
ncbi:MAG: alpha-glucan family phosphorylase [Candidatus Omnitrophica bacterium]|nr:alpha-glucan family phosphorylase [Candidatus Omnitrophota bacterium]